MRLRNLGTIPIMLLALAGCSTSTPETTMPGTAPAVTTAASESMTLSELAETSKFATHFRAEFPALAAGHRDRPLNYSGANECVGPSLSLTIGRFTNNGLEPTDAQARQIHAMAVRDICNRR